MINFCRPAKIHQSEYHSEKKKLFFNTVKPLYRRRHGNFKIVSVIKKCVLHRSSSRIGLSLQSLEGETWYCAIRKYAIKVCLLCHNLWIWPTFVEIQFLSKFGPKFKTEVQFEYIEFNGDVHFLCFRPEITLCG